MPVKQGKKLVFTPEEIKRAGKYAGLGLNNNQIAALFDVSINTLERRMREDEALAGGIIKGKAEICASVVQSLIKQAMKGNITACIFYLKAVHKWRENDPVPVQEVKNEWNLTYATQEPKTIEVKADDSSNKKISKTNTTKAKSKRRAPKDAPSVQSRG